MNSAHYDKMKELFSRSRVEGSARRQASSTEHPPPAWIGDFHDCLFSCLMRYEALQVTFESGKEGRAAGCCGGRLSFVWGHGVWGERGWGGGERGWGEVFCSGRVVVAASGKIRHVTTRNDEDGVPTKNRVAGVEHFVFATSCTLNPRLSKISAPVGERYSPSCFLLRNVFFFSLLCPRSSRFWW